MILSVAQILELLDRLKWEPVWTDGAIVVARKRPAGYSPDPTICRIEAALSLMLEAAERDAERRIPR